MAGIDSSNQFPQSRMAQAAKLGHSRFTSPDVPDKIQAPAQLNTAIPSAVSLAVPSASINSAGNFMPTTYGLITAIGGPLYATYDGSTPSPANYAIVVAAGASLPVQGARALAAIKVVGTSMSVSYWS